MGTFFDGWVASESQDHDAIKVKRLYVDINDGNWFDAAMFSQIMYWHGNNKETGKRRLQIFRDGQYWLAKRYEDWWTECRVNDATARKSIDRMCKRGLLVKEVWLFDGKPTVHLRVNIEGFEILANHCLSEAKESSLICANVADGNVTLGHMHLIPEDVSITETTAENTTETTEQTKQEIPAPENGADTSATPFEANADSPQQTDSSEPEQPPTQPAARPLTEWQQIVGFFMDWHSIQKGTATKFAQLVTGKAQGDNIWAASKLDEPANMRELKGWRLWVERSHLKKPVTAPWVQESIADFRKSQAYADAITDANDPVLIVIVADEIDPELALARQREYREAVANLAASKKLTPERKPHVAAA
jgi:hypothetical protein